MNRIDIRANCRIYLGVILAASVTVFLTSSAYSQDVGALQHLLKSGNIDELRKRVSTIPESDGEPAEMLFLRGTAAADGDKAITYYQALVNRYPESEWTDDALYRLYQYSYAIGAYNTADKHLSHLKRAFPSSPFLGREARKEVETATQSGAGFSVQVGAFSKAEDAEQLAGEMKKFGYTTELQVKQVGGKTLTAVWVGVFQDRESASVFAGKLKSRHKIETLVVRR